MRFTSYKSAIGANIRRLPVKRGVLIVSAVLAGAIVIGYISLIRSPQESPSRAALYVPSGATLSDIARQLHEQDIVRAPSVFKALVSFSGSAESIPAGTYTFDQNASVFAVAKRMSGGSYGAEPTKVTIPEGATVADIAIILDQRLQEFDEHTFLKAAIASEGYLYPDTYYFQPNETTEHVLAVLKRTFEQKIAPLEPELNTYPATKNEIITMASIIEREASTTRDRRKIAGVLWKRLDIGMPLQVDAPFIYFMGKNTFELTQNDLARESVYNTYTNTGLPPRPIANPSIDAIEAAITPIKNDNLYYLADRNGNTYYSETLDEHARKKRKYLN